MVGSHVHVIAYVCVSNFGNEIILRGEECETPENP